MMEKFITLNLKLFRNGCYINKVRNKIIIKFRKNYS